MSEANSDRAILIHGARQNNLKNLTLEIPLNQLVVVSGVSGSGKSSLVFDTLYAEGQRRYVETFSPYARQFLDRMDKPQVDRIEGIPPAVAIDQTNPVRTSRSTVGTMTELNDHVKLLFARAAELYCRGCGEKVARDTPESIYAALGARAKDAGEPRLIITFPVAVPKNFSAAEVEQLLQGQGYARIHARRDGMLEVVQDRLRLSSAGKTRVLEALEAALKIGQGKVNVYVAGEDGEAPAPTLPPLEIETGEIGDRPPSSERKKGGLPPVWRYSSDLHCAECDIHYADPTPSLFSFNSPIGACDTCRGFGRVIGIDFGLTVPDEGKTLREGAVRPWQTASFRECQDDLVKYANKRGIALDTPFRKLSQAQRNWVLEGEPEWKNWRKSWPGTWYGVRKFFDWLETKAYKMHIRVLLSKYRAYTPCPSCEGARLKHDALLWRLGTKQNADKVFSSYKRFKPLGVKWGEDKLAALPGLTMHDLMLLPVARCRAFFDCLHLPAPLDEAADLLLTEIRARLSYLCQVGLAYLTLDRQSRTLSGGEVQRINLTTALGTSLVNTLFVLDEPSIGLHPRDMGRVIEVMQRLRDAGNSLVVVEHDPQIMFAADRILDMGPGPGERGGEVVSFGTPDQLRAGHSLTAEYLSGRKRADAGVAPRPPEAKGAQLQLLGAAEHNLKNIDVTIPLARLVCVTGVSGSGKSTLVQDVLHAALLKAKGRPTETPGAHRALAGAELIEDAVMVDQSPIGRTTRSNPASYVGAFDAIRALFAAAPAAKERGYTAGTFSFNAGNGRCPSCSGNGFEHVEMQFLSDVYLRCPDCNGRRFRAEVLEVTLADRNGAQALSIADVLELTVAEALAFFADHAQVQAVLAPLADVGLEYLKLGQPVPTLSGGEAQRLKLARHLLEANKGSPAAGGLARKGKLFLFDEPTTGLHFDDIAKLLGALRKLIVTGHSVVVIEHNLDVIRASDWIIDLGPEGGDAGGEIVCTGTAAELRAHAASHTGKALRDYDAAPGRSAGTPRRLGVSEALPLQKALVVQPNCIRIHNAREHNLRNVDVDIPRDQFTVITGVSGSGKSTLAFDILFAEGQRRYLESLNAYARQFVQPSSRPDVDAIFGIPPTVAIEQRSSRGGRKSTVATLTEIYHFLRLLYVKLGTQYCPDCNVAIEPQNFDAIAARLMRNYKGERIGLLAPLVSSRKGYYTDLAKWAKGKGYDFLRVDGEFLPTAKWPRLDRFREHSIELPVADLRFTPANEAELREALKRALDFGKGIVQVLGGLDRLAEAAGKSKGLRLELTLPQAIFSTKRACPSCARSFPELDPRLFSFNSRHGWCASCVGTGVKISGYREPEYGKDRDASREQEDQRLDSFLDEQEAGDIPCPECSGRRLKREALAVRYRKRSIADLVALPVAQLARFFGDLETSGREAEIARDIVAEMKSRLSFLDEVGLGYLALARSAPTLSGGEAQRIRLAAQLGSNLRGVCYILDEPTIGLHPRDNRVLLATLEKLQAKGNTLVVVEHDEDTIRRAAHLLDLGPGAGSRGLGRGPDGEPRVGHRAVPETSAQTSLASAARDKRKNTRAGNPRRRSAQSEHQAVAPAAGAFMRHHRRVRQRQVHARARGAARQSRALGCASAPVAAQTRSAATHRLPRDPRRAARRARARGRSDADRQDAALLPRDLRRLLGRDPPAVRGHDGRAHARLEPVALFLQYRRRTLPCVRGPGREAHRDEFPARRESAVRRLPRCALQSGNAVGALQAEIDRRGPGHERGRGGRILLRPSVHPSRAAPAAGCGAGIPDAGPAEPDALRRRGAADQARHRIVEGTHRHRRQGGGASRSRRRGRPHSVRAGRTHGRPAHGRRGKAAPRAAPPGRGRQHGGGNRAQSGHHRRRRLDHRPRPRRRRRRRAHRRARHAVHARERACALAHRARAGRIPRRARLGQIANAVSYPRQQGEEFADPRIGLQKDLHNGVFEMRPPPDDQDGL